MVTFGRAEILFGLLVFLFCSLIAGMVLSCGWVVQQLVLRRPLLPDQAIVRRLPTPWRVGTVLLVVLAYLVVSGGLIAAYSKLTGHNLVDPAEPDGMTAPVRDPHAVNDRALVESDQAQAEAPAAGPAAKREHAPAPAIAPRVANAPGAAARRAESATTEPARSFVEKMAVFVVTDVVLIVLLPLIVRLTSGARLRDFGLSLESWPRQAAVGVVAALSAIPLVYSVQYLATRIWENNAHPLQVMLFKEFSPGVAELAILSGVVVAPIFEELLFRGILQSWLVRLFGRRIPLSPPPAELAERPEESTSWDADLGSFEAVLPNNDPVYSPPKPDLAEAARPSAERSAIILTSIVFAAVHAAQWPAPIGLFFLSLVIGTVYQRTGSLIAAVVVHATFNGLSTLAMFMAILAGQVIDPAKPAPPMKMPAPVGIQVPSERGWMHQSPKRARYDNSLQILVDERESDC